MIWATSPLVAVFKRRSPSMPVSYWCEYSVYETLSRVFLCSVVVGFTGSCSSLSLFISKYCCHCRISVISSCYSCLWHSLSSICDVRVLIIVTSLVQYRLAGFPCMLHLMPSALPNVTVIDISLRVATSCLHVSWI